MSDAKPAPADTTPDDAPDADTTPTENAPEGDAQEAANPPVKDDGSPWTAEDISGLQAALKAARQEARAAKRGKTDPPAEGQDPDALKAEADGRWKPIVVRQAARAAFAEAGLQAGDDALGRVLRMIDLDDLDVADDGAVDGLADQVAEIKEQFPALFAPAKPRPGRIDGAGKPADKTPKTAAERIAAQLLAG